MLTERFIGLDIHRQTVVIAAVNQQQDIILTPQTIKIAAFPDWIRSHLLSSDRVVLEATNNSWEIHDRLENYVQAVLVANTFQLKLISASAAKTDKQDALILAKLLAANLVPEVWVPPVHVRQMRRLTQHREQLLSQRSALKNKLHAILFHHNLQAPEGDPFTKSNELWWQELRISKVETLQIRHYWKSIAHLNLLLKETETAIAQLSASAEWQENMTLLLQVPGIGLYTGMTIMAAIGSIERFPSAKQLVGYAGLGARVHSSAERYHTGKISKRGRREFRTALIASAWVAVRWSDHWRKQFQSLEKRIGKHKAIVAIARKLLVTLWHLLSKKQADQNAQPEAVARSMMAWASQHGLARSQKISRLNFVRERLRQLGILEKVSSFSANGQTHFL